MMNMMNMMVSIMMMNIICGNLMNRWVLEDMEGSLLLAMVNVLIL